MNEALLSALVMSAALGLACSLLSVLVVARRWAFMGEGIAHAGFGGAGTAWLLSLIGPSWEFLRGDNWTYLVAVIFSLLVAACISMLTRHNRVLPDTAIGILLVGSMAWGFLASNIYGQITLTQPPTLGQFVGFEVQKLRLLPTVYAYVAVSVALGVTGMIYMLGKELVYCCYDPDMAEVSGVRAGLMHHALVMMLAVTIVLSMRMTGSLLVIALLILPGATALHLARSMRGIFGVWGITALCGVTGCIAGPLANWWFDYLPEGPVIVLVLLLQFGAALLLTGTGLIRKNT